MRACHGSAIAATPSPSDAPDHGGLEGEGRRERCPERDGSRITNTIHFWGWVHHHHQPNQIWPAGPDGTVVIGCNLASGTRGSEGQHHGHAPTFAPRSGPCVSPHGICLAPMQLASSSAALQRRGPDASPQNVRFDGIPPHDAEGYMWLYIEQHRVYKENVGVGWLDCQYFRGRCFGPLTEHGNEQERR